MSDCIGPTNIIPNNNQVVLQDNNRTITVIDNNCCTNVNVTQPITNVIQVNVPGPTGPQGPAGSGGNIDTGSFVTTSSFNSFTGSYNTGSFTGSFIGSLLGSASYAITASYALNGGSGGSGVPGGSDTQIQFNSASVFSGSSNFTYDYINGYVTINSPSTTVFRVIPLNGGDGVYLGNPGYGNDLSGLYSLNGDQTLAAIDLYNNQYIYANGNYYFDGTTHYFTSNNVYIDASSTTTNGSITASNGFLGNLIGTSSWASKAVTSSYITGSTFNSTNLALSSSYALTSSYVDTIKAGRATIFVGSPLSASVTFNSAFPNSNYSVNITGEDARIWSISSKTSTGFIINSNSSVVLTGPVYWTAIPSFSF